MLGIGSSIKHAEYGTGVVPNVTTKQYGVTFSENGLELIDVASEFEIIYAINCSSIKEEVTLLFLISKGYTFVFFEAILVNLLAS